jgi:hypothetical protein
MKNFQAFRSRLAVSRTIADGTVAWFGAYCCVLT